MERRGTKLRACAGKSVGGGVWRNGCGQEGRTKGMAKEGRAMILVEEGLGGGCGQSRTGEGQAGRGSGFTRGMGMRCLQTFTLLQPEAFPAAVNLFQPI